MPEPIPVFRKEGVKPALFFQKQQGQLRRLRKPPRTPPSRAPELEYFQRLNVLLSELRDMIGDMVIKHLPAIVDDAPIELITRKDVGEILEEVIDNVRIAFAARAPLEMIARRAGNEAESKNAQEQKRVVQTVLGIRPELGEPWLEKLMNQFTKSNARKVKMVTDGFIDRVEDRVSTMIREGARAEEIAKEIEADFISSQGIEAGIAARRAKLIARDQIASLQGDITRVRQTELGVTRYIWRTAEDEVVRASHRARNGKTFVWGKSIRAQLRAKNLPIDKIDGPPGKPINCRCYAEPVLEDLLPGLPSITPAP